MVKKGGVPFFLTFSAITLPAVKKILKNMKRFNYEFEVIFPDAVIEHVSVKSIEDLLSYFNVKFELKGFTDCETEFLVTAPSRDVANSVREWFPALQRVVLASSYSAMDKMRCQGWLYGEIREVESD